MGEIEEDPPLQQPSWLYGAAAAILAAGLGLIAKGFLSFGSWVAFLAVLIFLGIWLRTHRTPTYRIIVLWLILSSFFLLVHDRWIMTSPINKTLTLYNENDGSWAEGDHGNLQNLLTNPILKSDSPRDARSRYRLNPVLTHSVGEIETGVLVITAPNMVIALPDDEWTPHAVDAHATQYRFGVAFVKAGAPIKVGRLEFECPQCPQGDKPCLTITYEVHGEDKRGRTVTLQDTPVTLGIGKCQAPSHP